MTQIELAEKSGVSLRTLQGYDCGRKQINKAAAETVLRLADALGCEVRDILNPYTTSTKKKPKEGE